MPDATRRSPIPTAPGGVTETTLPGQPPRRDGLRLGDGDAPMVVTGDAAPTAAPRSRHPDAGIAFDADTPRAAAPRRDRLWMATADRLPCAGPGPIEARGAPARRPGDGLAARP